MAAVATPQAQSGQDRRDAASLERAAQHERDDREEDDDDEGAQPATAIVVTARKLDAARTGIDAELGATSYALDNDTIEGRPGGETGSIGAILGQTPGVGPSSSGLTIRGSTAVQVRINNVIVPEAIADPGDRLSSRFAATTRVITGTLPAQFGFAPGGVVSVTTKNGLYQHGGQLEMFAGNHDTNEPAIEWAGSTGSTSLFGSGSYETGNSRVTDLAGGTARDHRHEFGGLVFADHVIDQENRVSAIAGGSSLRDDFGATSIGSGRTGGDSAYLVGSWQHSNGALTTQASLFFGETLSTAAFANSQRLRSDSLGTQIDSTYRLSAASTVHAGLLVNRQLDRLSGSSIGTGRRQRTSVAAYLQDELSVTERFTVNAGARLDWLDGLSAPTRAEPRFNMVWRGPRGLTLHAGYARYAAAPPVDTAQPSLPLADETDDYFDAGAQQQVGAFTLGIDGYWRSARHLIMARSVPGTVEPERFAFRRARFGGLEFSATYASDTIDAWANLGISRNQGQGLVAAPGQFPDAAIASAGHDWIALSSDRPIAGSGGITWHLHRLALSGDVLAGSGMVVTTAPSMPNSGRAPAYASLGLSAVYHMRLLGHATDMRADLINFTDAKYLTGYAANLEGGWTRRDVGRTAMVGIEASF